jgi:agmatine deiminase
MITDNTKNVIYLADVLSSKVPSFYKHFVKAIATAGLEYWILNGTSDIWAVDYMPVQLSENQFVQYIFKPDYLTTRKYFHLLTDAARVWSNLELDTEVVSCDLVLDGGNLVYEKDTLIVTDKVFTENADKTKTEVIQLLENCFHARVIVIPRANNDIFGHADGDVRFVNADTVIVNEPGTQLEYFNKLANILKVNKLKYICAPCGCRESGLSAMGLYTNYLQIGNTIFVPVFDIEQDARAVKFFEDVFSGCNIIPVKSKQIARKGGVLRCVSWSTKNLL